jgi:CO/xanthine dehydrogenase FAD-binding subunit
MKRFELFEPTSLEEAATLLSQGKDKFLILAGGTDLLVQMKAGEATPEGLVSLRCVPALSYIRSNGDFVEFGPMTSHRIVEKSSLVRQMFPALAEAEDALGSVQIRNIATIGGNICNGAPSADTVPPLLAHDGILVIFGPKGERMHPLIDFFDGPGKMKLATGEILKEIVLPAPPGRTSSTYIKLTRRSSMELPLIGVAARLSFDREGKILEGRIALACAGSTCFRAKAGEALLPGGVIEESFLKKVGTAVLKESSPRDSFRCPVEYRREMIPVLVARALRQCYERCLKEGGRLR